MSEPAQLGLTFKVLGRKGQGLQDSPDTETSASPQLRQLTFVVNRRSVWGEERVSTTRSPQFVIASTNCEICLVLQPENLLCVIVVLRLVKEQNAMSSVYIA